MHLTLKATIAMLTLLTRDHMVKCCQEIDFFGPFQNIPLIYFLWIKREREAIRVILFINHGRKYPWASYILTFCILINNSSFFIHFHGSSY